MDPPTMWLTDSSIWEIFFPEFFQIHISSLEISYTFFWLLSNLGRLLSIFFSIRSIIDTFASNSQTRGILQTQEFWGGKNLDSRKHLKELHSLCLWADAEAEAGVPGGLCPSVKSTQGSWAHLPRSCHFSASPDIPRGRVGEGWLHGPALFSHYSSLRDYVPPNYA